MDTTFIQETGVLNKLILANLCNRPVRTFLSLLGIGVEVHADKTAYVIIERDFDFLVRDLREHVGPVPDSRLAGFSKPEIFSDERLKSAKVQRIV